MPSSPKIPREIILQHALQILIREGYSALNIKALAKEIGCSTQPISWHFGNMEGLRKALADYTLVYANKKMRPSAKNAVTAFEQVGKAYIGIALNEPNLFQFLFLNGSGYYPNGGATMLTEEKDNAELIKLIVKEFKITEQNAGQYLQDTLIYTHGIAAFVASGMMRLTEQEIMTSINRIGDHFLMQAGVPLKKIPLHNERQ